MQRLRNRQVSDLGKKGMEGGGKGVHLQLSSTCKQSTNSCPETEMKGEHRDEKHVGEEGRGRRRRSKRDVENVAEARRREGRARRGRRVRVTAVFRRAWLLLLLLLFAIRVREPSHERINVKL